MMMKIILPTLMMMLCASQSALAAESRSGWELRTATAWKNKFGNTRNCGSFFDQDDEDRLETCLKNAFAAGKDSPSYKWLGYEGCDVWKSTKRCLERYKCWTCKNQALMESFETTKPRRPYAVGNAENRDVCQWSSGNGAQNTPHPNDNLKCFSATTGNFMNRALYGLCFMDINHDVCRLENICPGKVESLTTCMNVVLSNYALGEFPDACGVAQGVQDCFKQQGCWSCSALGYIKQSSAWRAVQKIVDKRLEEGNQTPYCPMDTCTPTFPNPGQPLEPIVTDPPMPETPSPTVQLINDKVACEALKDVKLCLYREDCVYNKAKQKCEGATPPSNSDNICVNKKKTQCKKLKKVCKYDKKKKLCSQIVAENENNNDDGDDVDQDEKDPCKRLSKSKCKKAAKRGQCVYKKKKPCQSVSSNNDQEEEEEEENNNQNGQLVCYKYGGKKQCKANGCKWKKKKCL